MSGHLLTSMADLYRPDEYNPFCASNPENWTWAPPILLLVDPHECGEECEPDPYGVGFRWTPQCPPLRFEPRPEPVRSRLLTSVADLYPEGYDSFLLSPECEAFRPPMVAFVPDHMCSTQPCYTRYSEAYEWSPRMQVVRFGPASMVV